MFEYGPEIRRLIYTTNTIEGYNRQLLIEAVEYEQAKAERHPQPSPAIDTSIATYQDELRAIAAHLHDLAKRLASHPTEQAPMRTPHDSAYPHHTAEPPMSKLIVALWPAFAYY